MPNLHSQYHSFWWSVASLNKEDNSRLAKHPLVFNGRLANRGLTSLVNKATGIASSQDISRQSDVVFCPEYLGLGTRRASLRQFWSVQITPFDSIVASVCVSVLPFVFLFPNLKNMKWNKSELDEVMQWYHKLLDSPYQILAEILVVETWVLEMTTFLVT